MIKRAKLHRTALPSSASAMLASKMSSGLSFSLSLTRISSDQGEKRESAQRIAEFEDVPGQMLGDSEADHIGGSATSLSSRTTWSSRIPPGIPSKVSSGCPAC